MSKLFGTDGVRGVANSELTPELAFAIGRAGATVLGHSSDRHRPVMVGRDTRLSGTMIESAIVAGLTSVGRNVVSLGIVPTPAVARVVVAEGAAAGVMISASHNPIADNGIKFFGPDGFKLPDDVEREIESLMGSDSLPRPTGADIGVARLAQNLAKHYYDELYSVGADLTGLHIVVDGAYGAGYAIAPYALKKLGATVTELHCENDGSMINVNCGATHMESLQAKVKEFIAAGEINVIGVAFDGDADRSLFVDERGSIVWGDHVMFAIGKYLHDQGKLAHDTIVGTVMSNIGFERAVAKNGMKLVRTAVGDRYVLEEMRGKGYVLGGEQSGHIIDLLENTTGDGIMTAVTLFSIVAKTKKPLHELVADVVYAPQILVNVRTPHKHALQDAQMIAAIAAAEESLKGAGRLLIRPSGTEPLIRVMAEGDDQAHIESVARGLAAKIEAFVAGL